MGAAMRTPTRAIAAAALLALAAPARAQVPGRDDRTVVVPPPSTTSTGGEASAPAVRLEHAPRIRGFQLLTRDEQKPGEITLVGLEKSETPYRPDLQLNRTPLGAHAAPDGDEAALYARQLAILSGERLPLPPEDYEEALAKVAPPAPADTIAAEVARSRWSPWIMVVCCVALAATIVWRHRRARVTGSRRRTSSSRRRGRTGRRRRPGR